MASRSLGRALRAPTARQFTWPLTQRRTLLLASNNAKMGATTLVKPVSGTTLHLSRGMKTIDFAGHKETVYGTSYLCEELGVMTD